MPVSTPRPDVLWVRLILAFCMYAFSSGVDDVNFSSRIIRDGECRRLVRCRSGRTNIPKFSDPTNLSFSSPFHSRICSIFTFGSRESHQDIQVLGPLPYSGFSMRGFREKTNRTASIKLRRCAAGAKMHHFRSVKIDEYCLCTFLVLWMNLRALIQPGSFCYRWNDHASAVSVVHIEHMCEKLNFPDTLHVCRPFSTPRQTSRLDDYFEGEYSVVSEPALS